jgi:hypothetical protein
MNSPYYRGCSCRTSDGADGHGTGDFTKGEDPVELEYDYTCIVCARTVPMCEGGGVWDSAAAAEEHESHVGVCMQCENELTKEHGEPPMHAAMDILYGRN